MPLVWVIKYILNIYQQILEKDDINLPTINVEKDDNFIKEKVLILK